MKTELLSAAPVEQQLTRQPYVGPPPEDDDEEDDDPW